MPQRIISGLRHKGVTYSLGQIVDFPAEDVEILQGLDYPVIEQTDESPTEPQPRIILQQESTTGSPVAFDAPPVAPKLEESPPLLNLNTATVDDLAKIFEKINGIGRGSAQAIVDNGPYDSLEEVPDVADLVGIARTGWAQAVNYLTIGGEDTTDKV